MADAASSGFIAVMDFCKPAFMDASVSLADRPVNGSLCDKYSLSASSCE